MTVYVDDMKAKFGMMVMCHMIADTEAELHAMAEKIGVARKWYQGDHYDIAMSKRAKAVKHGAAEISWLQCSAMMMLRRSGCESGDPATAVARYRVVFRNLSYARLCAKLIG